MPCYLTPSFGMAVMSQQNIPAVSTTTTTKQYELASYKRCHKLLSLYDVSESMFSVTPLNRTPTSVLMTTDHRFNARGQSTIEENVGGCCLEPLRPMEESFIASEAGQVDCLSAIFSRYPELWWDENTTPNFMRDKHCMWYRMRKMLNHALQSPYCSSRLRKASI